jgi:hypothetical protein
MRFALQVALTIQDSSILDWEIIMIKRISALLLMLSLLTGGPHAIASSELLSNGEQLEISASSVSASASPLSFPRLSAQVWGGGVPDYYAQFDLLWWSETNPDRARAIKALNPDIKIVVTRDINAGAGMQLPEEWKVRTSVDHNQQYCVYIDQGSTIIPFANYTDFAPRLAAYGNKRFNEYIGDYFASAVDLSVFDGFATDGLWENNYNDSPCNIDIDLDRNGVNDYTEHGKDWVKSQLTAGATKVVQSMRATLGPNKILMINSGTTHKWGIPDTNGFLDERFGGNWGFDYAKNYYDNWVANSAQPSMPIMQIATSRNSPIEPDRNDFQLMRYGLGIALITGAYVEFLDYKRAGEHYWVKYVDEFDLDLGLPTGPAQKTPSGAWVRFYDNGMAIVNGLDSSAVTVTVNEVQSMSGYNPGGTGKYWRFRGGQDLAVYGANAMNNGDPFDAAHPITLSLRQTDPTISDGIVLLREPQAVVAPIYIDNWNSGTSPASFSPSERKEQDMIGFLQAKGCSEGSDYYTVRCAVYVDDPNTSPPDTTYLSPPYATAPGGSNAKAVYRPNIGIPGKYEVFEWHGKLNQGQLASNASYIINHAGGSTTITVDQTHNSGRWNSLGIFTFGAGEAGNVTISAQGANGTVMADAIKLVFLGETGVPTFTDVPFDHWAHDYIEAIYQGGYVTGCSTTPRMYCPERIMNRAESAVFVTRGVHGSNLTPPDPIDQIFGDVSLTEWYAKWATQLWNDGYTAGCGTNPLIYCPLQEHSIAEGCVFYLRMLNGSDYEAPDPTGIFVDVPLDAWYARWVEAAYNAGILIPCQESPEKMACPLDPLDRAMGAYMMFQAKGLGSQ